jgi:hypothetical protein
MEDQGKVEMYIVSRMQEQLNEIAMLFINTCSTLIQ